MLKTIKNDIRVNGETQLNAIVKMVDQLIIEDHSKSEEILQCQSRMRTLWSDLQRMSESKARDLKRIVKLVEFRESCEDTRSWMAEKFSLLNKKLETRDIKALQASIKKLYHN